MTPPDAMAEWEYRDDRGTRVLLLQDGFGQRILLVEAEHDLRADEFDARHRVALPSDRAIPDGGDSPERVRVVGGSDEAGKGERARALVVAAVALPLDDEPEALARGVRDSKLCTSHEVTELADWIATRWSHAVRVIPSEARARALHAHGGNETRLLASMHAECLREVHETQPFSLARVDRFAPNRPVAAACAAFLVDECVRGERHPACAAASILARAHAR
jgi:ribonuclease HIII